MVLFPGKQLMLQDLHVLTEPAAAPSDGLCAAEETGRPFPRTGRHPRLFRPRGLEKPISASLVGWKQWYLKQARGLLGSLDR